MTAARLAAARRRWDRFWFTPVDVIVYARLRIAFGTLVLVWASTLAPDLDAFFSRHGLVGPVAQPGWWRWSLLELSQSDLVVGGVYVGLIAAAVAVMLGWHTRASSIVVFVALTSLMRANPFVFNSGDALLRLLALYLVLMPAGARLSVDHRRAQRRGTPAPAVASVWPMRLVQLQVSVMYAAAATSKLRGEAWRDGTAVAHALQLEDLARVSVPEFVVGSPLAAAVATYGTVLLEAALAVLVWPRRTRAVALAAGVALHVSIDAFLRVGFFSVAVVVSYLSFVGPWARSGRSPGWIHRSRRETVQEPRKDAAVH